MNTAKRILIVSLVPLIFFLPAHAPAHEVRTPVIVDTDMALDDVRALALMLGSPHVEVKAVVTSDGSSSPEIGYQNVLRILEFMGAPEIPVGAGRRLDQPPPPWRGHSEALGWAELPPAPMEESPPNAVSVIARVVRNSEQDLTYVCLGPLTNLADMIRNYASERAGIQAVVYYGTPPGAAPQGWNTARDPEATELVSTSGIPVYFLHLEAGDLLRLDSELLEELEASGSAQSRLVRLLHRDERVRALLREGHLMAWDETVALYLDDPSLGSMSPIQGDYPLFTVSRWDRNAAGDAYLRLLSGRIAQELDPRSPVVLLRYPTNPGDLQEDVRPLIPEVVTRHGLEEWKAVVLTNELHRHAGVYSILGAKMGIRARELLGASLDELEVESHAGLKPPLSCMNDGLQVSTGASLGRGTITVHDGRALAAATFICGERTLHLRIREEVVKRIRREISAAVERYGALTPEYFKEVRRLALQYWIEMDRRTIFEELPQAQATAPSEQRDKGAD